MSILAHQDMTVIVQGITGREGQFHTSRMLDYGTKIVGGVSPGKGGEWVSGKPVFDTVEVAIKTTAATASVILVPPQYASDAIFEAIDAGLRLIVCITEGIPLRDIMRIYDYLKYHDVRLVGPNSFGVLSPVTRTKLSTMPDEITMPGSVGVVSRSGALTYEVINAMTEAGVGQSTIVGIGADPIPGTDFVELLEMFENDPDTESVVLLGEIGGRHELDAAEYIAKHMTKPVAAYVAGRRAPRGTMMGHAGAFIVDGQDTADAKIEALKVAGVRVANNPEEIPYLIK